jgi:hypothetical protein
VPKSEAIRSYHEHFFINTGYTPFTIGSSWMNLNHQASKREKKKSLKEIDCGM